MIYSEKAYQSELGRVRRYNIPYLDTRNLSNVCMLDENAWPKPEVQNPPSKILKLLKTVEDKDRPPKRTSRLDRDFIEWLGRATMMNPLFFYFRIFLLRKVSHRLTHQLIERMYDVFQNEKSGELIDAGNFVEKQNNFVISDLLITTPRQIFSFHIQQRLPHTGIIHPPHRGIPIRDSTKSRGREHHIAQALCGRSTA